MKPLNETPLHIITIFTYLLGKNKTKPNKTKQKLQTNQVFLESYVVFLSIFKYILILHSSSLLISLIINHPTTFLIALHYLFSHQQILTVCSYPLFSLNELFVYNFTFLFKTVLH